MGKRLIIKGADFSENGILPSEVDITNLVFSEVIQGRRDTDGSVETSTTRVSSPIVSLTSIGAKTGDKIVIETNPSGILFGFMQGISENDLSGSESHWYSADKGDYTGGIQGNEYNIVNYDYLSIILGYGRGSSSSKQIYASTVQGYINNGDIIIKLVRNDE